MQILPLFCFDESSSFTGRWLFRGSVLLVLSGSGAGRRLGVPGSGSAGVVRGSGVVGVSSLLYVVFDYAIHK